MSHVLFQDVITVPFSDAQTLKFKSENGVVSWWLLASPWSLSNLLKFHHSPLILPTYLTYPLHPSCDRKWQSYPTHSNTPHINHCCHIFAPWGISSLQIPRECWCCYLIDALLHINTPGVFWLGGIIICKILHLSLFRLQHLFREQLANTYTSANQCRKMKSIYSKEKFTCDFT